MNTYNKINGNHVILKITQMYLLLLGKAFKGQPYDILYYLKLYRYWVPSLVYYIQLYINGQYLLNFKNNF